MATPKSKEPALNLALMNDVQDLEARFGHDVAACWQRAAVNGIRDKYSKYSVVFENLFKRLAWEFVDPDNVRAMKGRGVPDDVVRDVTCQLAQESKADTYLKPLYAALCLEGAVGREHYAGRADKYREVSVHRFAAMMAGAITSHDSHPAKFRVSTALSESASDGAVQSYSTASTTGESLACSPPRYFVSLFEWLLRAGPPCEATVSTGTHTRPT